MTSTRNNNTKACYNLEVKSNHLDLNYRMFKNSQHGKPHSFLDVYKLPDSTQPTRIVNPHNLSNNPIDIESCLRGINSTNLVSDSFKCSPQLKRMDNCKFYERVPLILPNQITHDLQQRPLFS